MLACIHTVLWISVTYPFVSSGLENLSVNKASYQSSIAYGGVAKRANDGNTSAYYSGKSCSSTGLEFTPWWTVDLRGEYSIKSLTIYNRAGTSCSGVERCADRLVGFRVHISDLVNDANPESRYDQLCYDDDRPTLPVVIDLNCTIPVTGRYVTISLNRTTPGLLTLCEVQVYSVAITTPSIVLTTSVGDIPEMTTGTVKGPINTTDVLTVDGTTGAQTEAVYTSDTNSSTTTDHGLLRPLYAVTGTLTADNLSANQTTPVAETSSEGHNNTSTREYLLHPTTVNDGNETTDNFISASLQSGFVSATRGVVVESSFVDQVTTPIVTKFDEVKDITTAGQVFSVTIPKSKCCCSYNPSPVTGDNFIESVLNDLTIDTKNMTKTRRRYVSAHDDRPSSVAIGVSFVAFVMSLLGIIVCDITKVVGDFKRVHVQDGNT